MLNTLIVIVIFFIALQAYIRLVPSAAARWNVDPFAAKHPAPAGGRLVLKGGDLPFEDATQALAATCREMLSLRRTKVIAGAANERRLTFLTRSAVWGFPDYTTIELRETAQGYEIAMLARLRFGRSDFGVNQARLTQVAKGLAAAQ